MYIFELSLLSEYMWNRLMKERPEFLGNVNPNNEIIFQLFKDQGGY